MRKTQVIKQHEFNIRTLNVSSVARQQAEGAADFGWNLVRFLDTKAF